MEYCITEGMHLIKPTEINRRKFIQNLGLATATIPFLDLSKSGHTQKERPICIFSKHLQWLNYEEMAETIAEIGFDGVDLTVRPGGHVLPEKVSTDLPRAATAIDKQGLLLPMMTSRINGVDATAAKTLEVASDVGIQFYRMGYLSYPDDQKIPETINLYSDRLQKLQDMNRKYGMHGAYQNHAGGRVGGPVWDIWNIIKDLEPDFIGCQYDVRHAMVEGGYSWPLGLRLLSSFVKTTVIKDFLWQKTNKGWRAVSVPLGEGMVDFEQYFRLVKELNIKGPISLHYEYPVLSKEEEELPKPKKIEKTISVMKKDLQRLKAMLEEHDLS